MFVVQTKFNVIPGKQGEFLELNSRHMASQRGAVGYMGGYLLRFLGSPTRYIGLQLWESKSDREVYTDSRALTLLPSYNVVISQQTTREFYDVMAEVVGASEPKWVRHGEFDVNLRLRAEFERRLTENTVKEAEAFRDRGLASSRLLRYLGNDTKYLYIGMWRSQEDSEAFVNDPKRLAARKPFEDLLTQEETIEFYEVIAGYEGGEA